MANTYRHIGDQLTELLSSLKFIVGHPLNRGRPLSTLARYASWQICSRLKKEVVVDWIEGTKLVARNGMTGATGNIYCGLHEYADMSFVMHLLRAGDLFVDVGANIGSYTVLASGACGAKTVAIEPDPITVKHLERNIAENNLENFVMIRQMAVGNSSGSVAFTYGKDTTNQVAKPDELNVQSVPISRLDEILHGLKPTLIKLDIEGYEAEALRGAKRTLENNSLIALLVETVDEETLSTIKRHGFVQRGYDPAARKLTDPQMANGCNQLFVRNEAAVQSIVGSAPKRCIRAVYL